jgi:hypothetical protein
MTLDGEKLSRLFFNFEIERAPSEIPANLPGQFSLSGQIFFAAATLKELVQFQNKKIYTTFHHHFLSQKWSFQELKV